MTRSPFKEELAEKVESVKEEHPQAEVQVWAQDEQRLGLKPIIRRIWAKKGQRPVIRSHPG